ncbi:hypothetical protein D210916BOD24_11340 [Alteromonas sp. D210916BOD_24]|uniref:response regulator n=1 Tax=Alteromonas sp. D210916BOD_24 TaxID=3157618 RepID=UPI00399CCD36
MSIRLRYVIALILTATLVTLSFVVLHELISSQKHDAEVINIAGQQRMLSQRIALFGSSKAICHNLSEQQALAESIDTFAQNHRYLTQLPHLPTTVYDTYFGLEQLDSKVAEFSDRARDILSAENCSTLPNTFVYDASALLEQLDKVVSFFEQDATQRVDTVLSLEVYLWLATLSLLCIEAIFIFSPMEREIKRAMKKLASLKDRAESAAKEARKASKAKSEFLSSMSHELRTPMNGLFGMIELAIDNPEKSNIYLKKARTAGRQLLVLINDILDISKIEADKIKIEQAPVDLLQVLDDVVSLQRVYCQRKGLEFHYLKAPHLPHVIKGDITRISQILHNLLNNAIKFTQQGAVTLQVNYLSDGDEHTLVFEVMDTGIGIDASKINTIFDKFEQADQSTTREFGGTGLGLSIAKKLAQLMQGDISVTSTPGHGSTFTFSMKAEETQLPSVTVEQSTSLRCAIIDDLQTSREYFEHVVSSLSIEPKSYDSAKRFLEDDPFSFDVIILDLSMPEMSGVDLLIELQSMKPEKLPRIILISAELERLQSERDVTSLIWRTHAKPINRRELELDLGQLIVDNKAVEKQSQSDNANKRILLAEDNEINAEIVKTILQNQGYRLLHVKNGKDAVEVCKKHRFDLILMDCNMPIMGGIEASIILRETLALTTPIVALTANAFAEDREECLSAGMDDFLPKPLDKDTLLSCTRKYVAGYS